MAFFDPTIGALLPSTWDDDFEARYRAAMAGEPMSAPAPTTKGELPPDVIDYGSPSDGQAADYYDDDPEGKEVGPVLVNGVTGKRAFPPPPPGPAASYPGGARTDDARIAGFGGPTVAEEVAQGHGWPPKLDTEPAELAPPTIAPSQAPLQVDAITGVDQPPPSNAAVSTAPMPTERPEEELTPEELGQKYSSLPFEQQEMFRAKTEGAKQNFQAARLLDESTKAAKRAEENARDYQESLKKSHERAAQLDAEARQIADENPLDRISFGRKLAGVLASIVGGFGGGRNVGLEAVNRIADEAGQLHAQKLQLIGRQRGAVGEQMSQAGDMYKAAESVRLATYDTAIKSLESEVQQFDPRGTTALRVMDNLNALKAKRAEALAKYQVDEQKRIEAILKEQREVAQLQETQRHNIAGEKADATRAYADVLRAKAEDKKATAEAGGNALLTPDELRARGIDIPATAQLPPMTLKQAQKTAETAKSVEDWKKAARENSPQERARQFGVGELVDADGNALQFRSAESAEKVAKLKGSADFGVQLLDRMITARETYGWSSDLLKSPEWREMQADFAQYALEKKNIDELGVLAGPDMGLIHKAAGTSDPTELRDPTPGLKRARENIIEKTNSTVRAQVAPGVKPKRWAPPPPPPPAPLSPEQEQIKELIKFNPKRPTREETGGKVHVDDFVPLHYAKRIDRIVSVFNDPSATPEAQRDAGAALDEIKKNAISGAVRDYATSAAVRAGFSSIPATEEIEGPATSTAREEALK